MQVSQALFILAAILISSSHGLDYFSASLSPTSESELSGSGSALLVIDSSSQTFGLSISDTILDASTAGLNFPNGTLYLSFTVTAGIVQNVTGVPFPDPNFLTLIQTQQYSVFVGTEGLTISGNLQTACLNGVVEPSGCSCYSGFIGDTYCETNALGTCTLGLVDPMTTEVVAEFRKSLSSISSTGFTFVVDSTGREDRYFSSLYLNNPNCSYPSSAYHKDFNSSSCTDTFTGTFALSDLSSTCLFTQDVQPSITYLSGAIYLTAIDALPPLRGQALQRTTSSLLRLRLGIPTSINITSNATTIISPSTVTTVVAAVTFQSYDEVGQVGIIELTTLMQWPFYITGVVLNYQSNSLDVGVSITNSSLCDQNTAFSVCTQVSTLTFGGLDVTQGCDFSGLYDVTWTYALRTGAQDIPYTISDPNLYTNVTVNSGQVCGTIDIDASIKGTLTAYPSIDFSSPSITFIADTTIYFLASVTTDVDLQSITLINLSIFQGTTTTNIVTNQVIVSTLANYNGTIPSSSPSEFGFSIFASYGSGESDLLYSADGESAITFSVQADFQVSYLTTFGRRRDIQRDSIKVIQEIVLDTSNHLSGQLGQLQNVQNANSAASLSFGLAPLLVGFAGYVAA